MKSIRSLLPRLLGVLVAVLMGLIACDSSGRELSGCYVSRFARLEFRDAADGSTYFLVAGNKEVVDRLREIIGNATFTVAPVTVTGVSKKTPDGSGPNGRYLAVLKVTKVVESDNQQLCIVKEE